MTNPDHEELVKLAEYQERQCNRHVNGYCSTLRCMKRGGWHAGGDMNVATCEEHETAQALRRLASAAWWDEAIEAATLICRDAANEADGNASRAAMAEELAAAIEALRREAPAPEVVASIVTCCVTGAIPGDGGACGDCDPCIMGEASVPEAVKRLIAEKNSLIQRIGELEDASGPDAWGGVRETLLCDEWSRLVEKDDRTSPEEYPDMCLITREEVGEIIDAALSTPPAAAEKGADEAYERAAKHFEESEHLVWSNDEAADAIRRLAGRD